MGSLIIHVSSLFMVLNAILYNDTMPSGMGVLEVAEPIGAKNLFVPLQQTRISGNIQGMFASCIYTQVFGFRDSIFHHPIEAIFRFPIPPGGIITEISLKSGDEEIRSLLVERDEAQDRYYQTFKEGKLSSLLVQESPDIFTLFVTGINPDVEISVSVSLLFRALSEGENATFRFPLTTVPRFIHEMKSGHSLKKSLPFLSIMDPGYQASIDLTINGYGSIESNTHQITIVQEGETAFQVSLSEGTIVPNQDFVLTCIPVNILNKPVISCFASEVTTDNVTYIMTTISPPGCESTPNHGDFVILADASYPQDSPQRNAIDSAVRTFLHSLHEGDVFSLGLFHSDSVWLSRKPIPVNQDNIKLARNFLSRKVAKGEPNLSDALKKGYSVRKSSGSVLHHLILITNGRMTDDGKIFRVIQDELKKKEIRYLSVLCIEACPNAPLIEEIARRGKGIARFMPLGPGKKNFTYTIEGMVRELHESSSQNLYLHINREYIETADGSTFSEKVPISVFGKERFTQIIKVPNGYPLSVQLEGYGPPIKADIQYLDSVPIKQLFGAVRVQILEQVMNSLHSKRDIELALEELGYSHSRGRNSSTHTEFYEYSDIEDLIVQESLRYQVPSSLTALISLGNTEGKSIKATIFIPSALSLSDSLLLSDSIPADNFEICSMKEVYPDLEFGEYEPELPPILHKKRKKPDIIKCESPGYPPASMRNEALPVPILRSVSPQPAQTPVMTHEIRITAPPDSQGKIYDEIAKSSFSIHAIVGISIPPEGEIGIFIGEDIFPRMVVTTRELINQGTYSIQIDVKKGERVKVYVRTVEIKQISIFLLIKD